MRASVGENSLLVRRPRTSVADPPMSATPFVSLQLIV
uniref:Uncharacterized protein n=1 Tax=Arundo donax TaxID=35708 RepID=A0A0A9DUT6_ARUDO